MPNTEAALVDIVREFLTAHQQMRRMIERYRAGDLRFESIEELIGDDESSVLFRLKERCHSLFRQGDSADSPDPRNVLFDLAVGSLFHEAMSFRENFYQHEVYGPRVRALRRETGAEADPLFHEFERILASVEMRLGDGLTEAESLLDRTREQLETLLSSHCDDGYVLRYLIEHEERVSETFPGGLEELLRSINDDPAVSYTIAGRSYLLSGHYDDACAAFAKARERRASPAEIDPLDACAVGMRAYLEGSYTVCVETLREWIEAVGDEADGRLVTLANAAVSRIGKFLDADRDAALIADAEALLRQLGTEQNPSINKV